MPFSSVTGHFLVIFDLLRSSTCSFSLISVPFKTVSVLSVYVRASLLACQFSSANDISYHTLSVVRCGCHADVPEWERELQAELQEYEVVDDGTNLSDADLEQEIMKQIEAETQNT